MNHPPTPPPGDDPEAHRVAHQRVSDTRVGGSQTQISGVTGNVTVNHVSPDRRYRWPAVVASAVLVIGSTVWVASELVDFWSEPLSVTATTNPLERVNASANSNRYIFDKPVDELAPLPEFDPVNGLDREAGVKWAYDNGGIDADVTMVEVVVEANKDDQVVVLRAMKINAECTDPPGAEQVVVSVHDASEGVTGRTADVDLDSELRALTDKWVSSGSAAGESWDFPLSVSKDHSEVVRLRAATEDHDCEWTAELRFTVGGKEGTVRIDNKGVPFRTASSVNSTAYHRVDREFRLNP